VVDDSLVGTWCLLSCESEDDSGQISYPFGHDPAGFITYGADGRMAVQFGRADRPGIVTGDWFNAPDAEVAAAARPYFAYCGTYSYADQTVTHHVELSLLPDWIGIEVVRSVAIDGDRVTLTTPPHPIEGRPLRSRLVWQRV